MKEVKMRMDGIKINFGVRERMNENEELNDDRKFC